MTIIVYTISAPAPIDAEDTDLKQYQPTGWCYVCGSASWVWDQSGPLCPSHANALDEYTNDASQCSSFGCVDGCSDCARPLPMDGQDYHHEGES